MMEIIISIRSDYYVLLAHLITKVCSYYVKATRRLLQASNLFIIPTRCPHRPKSNRPRHHRNPYPPQTPHSRNLHHRLHSPHPDRALPVLSFHGSEFLKGIEATASTQENQYHKRR